MEIINLFKAYLPIITFLVKVLITFLAIVIALDDRDTYNAIKGVLNKNIENKIIERNEMFEAITTTKGHISKTIWKRYLGTFVFSLIVECLQFIPISQNVLKIILSLIPTMINITALWIAVRVKNKLNKQYDRLRRNS